MQEHHLFRILGLLLLSLYATAAIIKPSTAISKPSSQNIPASQSSTPPIIDTDPSTWPDTQINYHSIPGTDSVQDTRAAAASTEDTGKVRIDSDRKREQNPKPASEEDSIFDVKPDYWPMIRFCGFVAVGSFIVRIIREFTR